MGDFLPHGYVNNGLFHTHRMKREHVCIHVDHTRYPVGHPSRVYMHNKSLVNTQFIICRLHLSSLMLSALQPPPPRSDRETFVSPTMTLSLRCRLPLTLALPLPVVLRSIEEHCRGVGLQEPSVRRLVQLHRWEHRNVEGDVVAGTIGRRVVTIAQ